MRILVKKFSLKSGLPPLKSSFCRPQKGAAGAERPTPPTITVLSTSAAVHTNHLFFLFLSFTFI